MRVAFVTPWYGPDIPGGMEAETRRTVAHLHAAGVPVEVLTTCIRDLYADWGKNHHRPGRTTLDGIPVHRFPVESRDRATFDQLNWRLMHNIPIDAAHEHTFVEEMFRVPTLYEHIAAHCDDTIYFFIPYMFATTVYGAPICPQRSFVIPCLHDEAYARLGIYKEVLSQVKGLIFHTDAERDLSERLCGTPAGQIRTVVGEGVDTDVRADARRFRKKYGLDGPFVLYAGRREMGKNTPQLLRFWAQYVQDEAPDAKLVLIGPGDLLVSQEMAPHVVDLGFVSAQDKYDAFAAATVFCQPSLHESFSLVLMEAWLTGTPALVHGRCAVTTEHCRKADGGLYYENYDEFAATLTYLLTHPDEAQAMGAQGRHYVLQNFRWDVIIDKYRRLIRQATA